MEVETLKRIIIDQKEEAEEFFKQEKIIERDIDAKNLLLFLKHPNVLIISGVRRSGKSVLALSLLKQEKYGHINFDDERLAGFESGDFDKLLQGFYELYGEDVNFFVFDEIQNIENWQLFINRLRRTKKIIITGSNANLLSGELATHLTGRYVDFALYPFSFKEFIRLKGERFEPEAFYSTVKIARIKKLLQEYLEFGGFPEAYKFGRRIVEKIYEDIINKDILLHYKVKNKAAFKELSKYLLSNFAAEMGYSKLRNIFEVKNVHTIKNYVSYLSATCLLLVVEKFSYKLKQQILASKKVYAIDTGLVNFLSFQFSENLGRLMENLVFLELLRKSAYGAKRFETYFWQSYTGEEVDFIIKEGKTVQELIQVSYDLSNPATKRREFKALIKASIELKCKKLTLITWEESKEEKFKGRRIEIVPLWKWLLEKD